ncbi:response regulator [Nocardioides sp. Root151]|uniref:response regulator n=1 Tax=Nocardioides sp. Root151 TaxID=1736475 RepID=UPI00070282BE|nr:response regulator transcription factor [Nocardioides sp. Root151]KQZ67578.1 hypothetical protein ASD66_21900 [Nocardioides sp. Root151]
MRLVLGDDHLLLLEAMALGFTDHGHEVLALATTRRQTLEAVRTHAPDACLLDIGFPDGSGLDLIGPLLAASATTRVVIMSGWTEHTSVARALREGASGFVGKGRPFPDIVSYVERAGAGHLAVDPDLVHGAGHGDAIRPDPLWQLRFLTTREWDALGCLMDGLSTAEIATRLGVRASTARTHVQGVLTKLGVHSRLQAAALLTAHSSSVTWPAHSRGGAVTWSPPDDAADDGPLGGSRQAI